MCGRVWDLNQLPINDKNQRPNAPQVTAAKSSTRFGRQSIGSSGASSKLKSQDSDVERYSYLGSSTSPPSIRLNCIDKIKLHASFPEDMSKLHSFQPWNHPGYASNTFVCTAKNNYFAIVHAAPASNDIMGGLAGGLDGSRLSVTTAASSNSAVKRDKDKTQVLTQSVQSFNICTLLVRFSLHELRDWS